jgi:uncharacterized LabA/DUF88 family protein
MLDKKVYLKGEARKEKKVSIFVDGNNAFFAQQSMGWFFDPRKLLDELVRGRELVGCFWYTAIRDDTDQRGFRSALVGLGFSVRTKALKQYILGDDYKTKGNLDVEMAVDMLITMDQYEVAILITGDGDFRSAIEVLQSRGIEVIVVSTRKMVSKDLLNICSYIELEDLKGTIQNERSVIEKQGVRT